MEHPPDRRADDGIGAVLQLPAHPDVLLDGRGPGDPSHREPDPDDEPVLDAGEHGQRDPRRAVGRGRGPGRQGDGGRGRVGNALGRGAHQHPDPADRVLPPRSRDGADGAQAFANAYLTYRTRVAVDAYAQARQAIQTQIDELRSDLEVAQAALEAAPAGSSDETVAANEVDQLSSQIAGLNTQVASLVAPDITPGTLIQPAEVPTSPSSPNHRQDVALGFVAGLVLGVGFAFLRERMDDRIHGRAQLEAAVGAPVLAVVPEVPGWRKRAQTRLVTTSASESPAAEAYRSLRTNLQFISRDGSMRVISVTSPLAGEGKTTTVANLATTLALTGKRVMALSADLRKPRLHRFFGLDNEEGLSSVLAGQAQLGEVARRVEGLDSLRIVTSGPVPPNPAELLSSDEMESVLKHLGSNADYVVIDTPPALVVSDAMIVAPRVDGVVVVVDADTTTGGAASHAIDQLEQVGGNVIGSVLNRFDPSKARYYSYAGRYAYAYRYHYRNEDSGAGGEGSNGKGRRAAARTPDNVWP